MSTIVFPELQREILFYKRDYTTYLRITEPKSPYPLIDRPAEAIDQKTYPIEWASFVGAKPDMPNEKRADTSNTENHAVSYEDHIKNLEAQLKRIAGVEPLFNALVFEIDSLKRNGVISKEAAPSFFKTLENFRLAFTAAIK